MSDVLDPDPEDEIPDSEVSDPVDPYEDDDE
jgi:hypothetical protein